MLKVGLDANEVKEVLRDLDRVMAGQVIGTPLDPVAWQDRLSKATDRICRFPKAEILALDSNFRPPDIAT